mgnify:FL=1
MAAMELVSDRDTKSPVDGQLAIKVQKTAYEAGALIRVSGPNMIISPSLIIDEADIDTVLSAIEAGVKAAS